MTLRARLVATVLLLLALAGAVIGVVTTVSLRTFLIDRLDEDVVTSGRIVGRLPPPDRPDAPTTCRSARGCRSAS